MAVDSSGAGRVTDGAAAGRRPDRESAKERADRRWHELLQEVRVAQTGVQVLLGFLFSVAFTARFADIGTADRWIYVATVVSGAASTGTLIAPVALHRLVTGRRLKPQAVEWASRLTLAGLVLLLCTVTLGLLLILRVVLDDAAAGWITGALSVCFTAVWFVLPVCVRSGTAGRAERRERA